METVPKVIKGSVIEIFHHIKNEQKFENIGVVALIDPYQTENLTPRFMLDTTYNVYTKSHDNFIPVPSTIPKVPLLFMSFFTPKGQNDFFYAYNSTKMKQCFILNEQSFWDVKNHSKVRSPLTFSNAPKIMQAHNFTIFSFLQESLIAVHKNQGSLNFRVKTSTSIKKYRCDPLAVISFENEIVKSKPFLNLDAGHCTIEVEKSLFLLSSKNNCQPKILLNCQIIKLSKLYLLLLIFPVMLAVTCAVKMNNFDI